MASRGAELRGPPGAPPPPPYIPVDEFEGAKAGYVFKLGDDGMGYYLELGGPPDPPAPPARRGDEEAISQAREQHARYPLHAAAKQGNLRGLAAALRKAAADHAAGQPRGGAAGQPSAASAQEATRESLAKGPASGWIPARSCSCAC